MNKTQQLFVIGNPRSGTSLLRIMLNSHSSIVIPPECGFIQWWFQKYQFWNSDSKIGEFIADLETSKKIETWQLDFKALTLFLKEQNIKSYNELVFNVVSFYGRSIHQKKNPIILGDKNNYYINHLDSLKCIAPQAKFLIIIRDPRDVYCSYKGIAELKSNSVYVPKLPQNTGNFIKNWITNQSEILQFLAKLDSGQFFVISYEDLVMKSKFVLDKVCGFLGLHFEDNMMHYYETNDEPEALLEWKKKTLRPPDPTSIGVYKTRLSQLEIEAIENHTFEIYKHFISIKN